MDLTDHFLWDHTINYLDVIDCGNKKFHGSDLTRNNKMTTRKGTKMVSITPLNYYKNYSERNQRLVTVKSELGDRVKMRQVSTVEELAHVLREDLGMRILFREKPI